MPKSANSCRYRMPDLQIRVCVSLSLSLYLLVIDAGPADSCVCDSVCECARVLCVYRHLRGCGCVCG